MSADLSFHQVRRGRWVSSLSGWVIESRGMGGPYAVIAPTRELAGQARTFNGALTLALRLMAVARGEGE